MNKPEIILVASGKGGVGKSTVTVNLAATLAQKGYKTCIIDLDLNLGKIDLLLGLEGHYESDLSDIILDQISTKEIIIEHKEYNNLFVIPAGRNINNNQHHLSKGKLTSILDELDEYEFDFIFLDCPAGIDKYNPFRTAVKCSHRSLIITTPETPSIRDADSAISILENYDFNSENKINLIINRYYKKKGLNLKNKAISPKVIQTKLAIPLLYTISDNINYRESVNKSIPGVYINSKINSEFEELSKKLLQAYKIDEK